MIFYFLFLLGNLKKQKTGSLSPAIKIIIGIEFKKPLNYGVVLFIIHLVNSIMSYEQNLVIT